MIRTLKQVEKEDYLPRGEWEKYSPKFAIGDKVTFTNDYGVKFEGKKVVGISKPWFGPHGDRPRYYFAPHDAYWFPVEEESLTAA